METQKEQNNNSYKNFSYSQWILPVVLFCLGVVAGFFSHQNKNTVPPLASFGQAIRSGGYQFINPLLDFDIPQNTFVELTPFKDKIQAFVDNANASSDHIDFAAVYFRDLNNGPWFGINASATFAPASLLKVPLMMAYYKLSETDPGLLQKQIPVTAADITPVVPNQQTIVPQVKLQVGLSYTVDELIDNMIIYSGNDATQLLIEDIDSSKLVQIYNDFGIELPSVQPSGTQVDVVTYAKFFRILFNASYLSKDDSERALKLLSQVDYKDGLVAGTPGNVLVAHKFGERVENGNERQLHDCGIVYYPGHPYLLCVMTRGDDLTELSKLIKDTSQQVYQEVDAQYSKK